MTTGGKGSFLAAAYQTTVGGNSVGSKLSHLFPLFPGIFNFISNSYQKIRANIELPHVLNNPAKL